MILAFFMGLITGVFFGLLICGLMKTSEGENDGDK